METRAKHIIKLLVQGKHKIYSCCVAFSCLPSSLHFIFISTCSHSFLLFYLLLLISYQFYFFILLVLFRINLNRCIMSFSLNFIFYSSRSLFAGICEIFNKSICSLDYFSSISINVVLLGVLLKWFIYRFSFI